MSGIFAFALRKLLREWRSGELLVLFGALCVAVAALTAVGFFTERVAAAVNRQATEVLAADLVLTSGRELDPSVVGKVAASGLATARKISFPSVVLHGDESSLADIDAVDSAYPLRGRLRVADNLLAAPVETDAVPAPGEAWAEARLLARLGADTGAEVRLGASSLRITRVLDFAPDRGWQFSDLAPALLVNIADIPATGLVGVGSRVTHSLLMAGPTADVAALRAAIAPDLAPQERLRDLGDARPEIRTAVDRAGRFLKLAALVGTLLAAVAVAMSARRYAQRQLDVVALMKCMGAKQSWILSLITIELLALAIASGLVGSGLGYAAQWGLAWLASDLIGAHLPAPGLRVGGLGVGVAVLLLAGFALPPLLALRHVPPARVLRRDLGGPGAGSIAVYAAACGASLALLLWLLRDLRLLAYVALGAVATLAILGAGGSLLVLSLRRLRGGVGVAWRYGLANIGRRGPESVVQIVAFGIGLMALLLLTVVRTDLLGAWRATLPSDAPNHFLINIQPGEQEDLREFLESRAGITPTLVPLVRARIAAIDGVPVADMTFETVRGERFARRESNLSWSATLPKANRIVAGEWWPATGPENGQVSVDQEFARRLGMTLGTGVEFDIAGEPVTATVTSIRAIDWDSFQPNFFMVLSPGVLEDYPATYVCAIYLDEAQRPLLLDLLRRFPSVSPIDMAAVFAQVRGVMDKASQAVQYVFLFTLLAGVAVLLAAVQATRDERRYESAMLRTLGATAAVIRRGIMAEFAMLGLLSGLLAALGAAVSALLVARQVFNLDYTPGLSLWLIGMFGGTLLVGVSGMLATRSVATHPPIETLRA